MGCCGSSRGTVKYVLTTPDGEVLTYLTEPEVRIALATYGGGSVRTVRENTDS